MKLIESKILSVLAVFCTIIAFVACKDAADSSQKAVVVTKKQKQLDLDSINKALISKENNAINDYIKTNGNEFIKTGTGLRYYIENQGDSILIKTGEIIVLDYESRLLNGDLLYSSKENGRKVFEVGHGGVESGLEEAILHLHRGDEAEIIIPARLAHGLTGDGGRIPPNATIVYKVKIIENQTNSNKN